MINTELFRTGRRVILFSILLIISIVLPVCADESADTSFHELIAQLREEGVIPDDPGKFLSLGDFEDNYANTGLCSVTPLLEAKRFVLSADISWSSGNQTPNAMVSGCGVVFNTDPDGSNHLMFSVRMDGCVYITGYGNYKDLSYAKFPYKTPSILGSAKLTLVIDGQQGSFYLDGKRILRRNDLADWGDILGLSVLSGTYQDFGTRCVFKNIGIYIW